MAAGKKRSESAEARRFALILAGILLVLAALSRWRHHVTRAEILVALAAASLLCAFLLRPLWVRFYKGWLKVTEGISWVMTRVILSVFFFVILAPYGLVRRLFGKDSLDTAWRDGRPSYWIEKPPGEYTLERYRKQY